MLEGARDWKRSRPLPSFTFLQNLPFIFTFKFLPLTFDQSLLLTFTTFHFHLHLPFQSVTPSSPPVLSFPPSLSIPLPSLSIPQSLPNLHLQTRHLHLPSPRCSPSLLTFTFSQLILDALPTGDEVTARFPFPTT